MWLWVTLVLCALIEVSTSSEGDGQNLAVVKRSPRGRKNKPAATSECRYKKGQWGECNPTTNQKTRILTLKRGDENECDSPKIETKKCTKLCRYQKGQWSECAGSPQMERVDSLKPGSDPTCEPKRRLTKKCKDRSEKRKSGKKSRNNNNN